MVLFPVLAWQAKILLDVEPDVQRRLARVPVGPAREQAPGCSRPWSRGWARCLVALVFPWLVGGVTIPGPGDPPLAAVLALGLWAHLLALPPAVAWGALASRALTRSAGYGVAVLAVGVVGALVLGLRGSVAPWLVPPVMATARALAGSTAGRHCPAALTGWALAWAGGGADRLRLVAADPPLSGGAVRWRAAAHRAADLRWWRRGACPARFGDRWTRRVT